ncbi:uncharacterized protein LOC123527999 [Mercenaria mercenaria]|uniref:uncharacterized protein LOC123527999 n=1 Tax=Mercenaria mercenaria TaxID=6596 RepID=UPI001E1E15C0|nr:uncharacterized protein LOC123527999 [Mercenaria mercenaria]
MGCSAGKVERDFVKVGRSADYNKNIPSLTDTQKDAIQKNWQNLKLHIANIGVMTYVSMFESRPELIKVFAAFKGKDVSKIQDSGLLQQHALRVMATIDKCITRINQPSDMISMLHEVGYNHRQYSVPSDDIQIILPHFLSAMKPYIQDKWCEELEEAWKTFLSLVVYHMKEGIEQTHGDVVHIHKTNTISI